MIIFRSFRHRMRRDKCCRENHNTNFISRKIIFENHAVNEILCENTVESDKPQITV